MPPPRWPPRDRTRYACVKLVLIILNVLTTSLTLFTGLNESPLLVYFTGKYDAVRHRLRHGGVTYDISQPDSFRPQDLAPPRELADYLFLTTPRRDPSSIGESRQLCLALNSNAAPVMISYYDDFWGKKTPRRIQIYLYSISTPFCDVLNLQPAWRDACITDLYAGNATQCHDFILNNFDTLRATREIQMGVVKDTGANGVPFLRCRGRPLVAFRFTADLLAHQAYWSGQEYHVTMQSSDCDGVPLVRKRDGQSTLFHVRNVDEAADMLVLLPRGTWLAELIPWLHSGVTLVLILRGVVLALFHTKTTTYLPHGIRCLGQSAKWLRVVLPFMEVLTHVSGNDRSTITLKGSLLLASDVWVTHWLFMWLSMLDAVVNLRATYVRLQIAESLLLLKTTFGNLVFLFSALVKIAWLMCLVHIVLRVLFKLAARALRSLRLIRSGTRKKIEWNVDGIAMLLSYRVYLAMLLTLTLVLLVVKSDPSFMVRAVPFKVGVYGGPIPIAAFGGSEVACDLVTLLGFLALLGHVLGVALLYTNFRYVVDNSVMRFLQQRYVVSGWDGLLAADMLGLHPWDPDLVVEGHGYTKLSLGSLLQLLYLSGPSGFVHLAGDYIFHDNGFSKDPAKFSYSVPRALAMGLIQTKNGSTASSTSPLVTLGGGSVAKQDGSTAVPSVLIRTREDAATAAPRIAKTSIFERRLRVVSDGYFGKILFLHSAQAGQLTTNKDTGQREYQVVDALTTMTILDIKFLMGSEKKLRVQ